MSQNYKVNPLILLRPKPTSKTHKNSILTPSGRRAMVDCALVKKMKQYEVVAKLNVHNQTLRKWVKRFNPDYSSGDSKKNEKNT